MAICSNNPNTRSSRVCWASSRMLSLALCCFVLPLSIALPALRGSSTPLLCHSVASPMNQKLQMAAWRHAAYALAPFVFPQLYACPRSTSELSQTEEWRSQSHEDRWLNEHIFHDQRFGYFVELGALDGSLISNTWFFEKRLDWRGLLIEGHPADSPRLRANAGLRPNAAIFTVPVCGIQGESSVLSGPSTMHFTEGGGGMGTTAESANEVFLNHWHKGVKGSIPVDCMPLQRMLDAAGLSDIDLLSLDVEGAELIVLKTLDWHVVNIRVIIVELDGGAPDKDQAVRELLAVHGFAPATGNVRDACIQGEACTVNEVFVNPNFAAVKAARVRSEGQDSTADSFHPRAKNALYIPGTAMRCK